MENRVSMFMLEKYRLDELSPSDKEAVENALARDTGLQSILKNMDDSDRELRLRYPVEDFSADYKFNTESPKALLLRIKGLPRTALFAAALVLCILVPVSLLWRSNLSQDRAKGSVLSEIELALYLRGSHEMPLPQEALLEKGNTVQLAYSIPAGEHYGVIFSIDGRSVVTMHHPLNGGQSSLLVSGRRTYLNAAYTLDDAPDFELFVFLVSEEALDAQAVIQEARRITENTVYHDPFQQMGYIEDEIRTAFVNSEAEFLRMLKR